MLKKVTAVVIMLVFAGVNTITASNYYVAATKGNDTNAGTVKAPFKTIMRAVKKSRAGDTIYLDNGLYRETVTFTGSSVGKKGSPITLSALSGAKPIIKGSDIVTGWKKHQGKVWVKKNWPHNSQQLFVNGQSLQQIGFFSKAYPKAASDGNWMIRTVGKSLKDIRENSFYYDENSHALYVWLQNGADPNKQTVEASVRMYLINANNGQYVNIKGITFRHSNTTAFKQGGAALEMGSFCIVQNCDIQWCDFAGISPGYRQQGTKIINCIVSNNGNSGISASHHSNCLIDSCQITGNNYRHFNQTWHAGGIKICAQSWGTIKNCEVGNNLAQGIWFDYCFKDTGKSFILNNRIYNNARQGGIMIELSDRVTIKNNMLYNNDQFGIHYVCSSYGVIENNVIVGQRDFIALDISGPRNNSEAKLSHNIVRYNTVIGSKCKYDYHIIQPDGKYVTDNSYDYNFFARKGGPKLRYNAGGRKKWRDIMVTSDLKKWQHKTGVDLHSVVIDKDKLKNIKIRTK